MNDQQPIAVCELATADIDRWFQRGITLLVGSWISSCGPYDPPGAALPDGGSWSSIVWNQFFVSSIQGTRFRSLKRLRCNFEQLPFEALMQCYQDRDALRVFLRTQYCRWAHNDIHRVLIAALSSQRIQSIITTNYDLGLDHCLGPKHKIVTVFDRSTWAYYRERRVLGYVPYFKIHGTALPNLENSLVCDLGSEKRLSGWKLELLQECVKDRALIIVGYSGRDFDICPALSLSSQTDQAETVWLTHDPKKLSPMAKRLIDSRNGMLVCGDGVAFLERLFGEKVNVESWIKPKEPELTLDPHLFPDWRLRTLNWMSAGTLVLSCLDDFVGPETEKHELHAAALAHIGKYRDVVSVYSRALEIDGISEEIRTRLRLGRAAAWLIYGCYFRSLLDVWKAHRCIERMLSGRLDRKLQTFSRVSRRISVRQFRSSQDLIGRLYELEMVMYMRAKEMAQGLNLSLVSRYCRLRSELPYRRAKGILERAGAHERLQALEHNAERLGIAKPDGMALPIDPGYSNLGLGSMQVIAVRDRLRKTPDPWSQADLKAAIRGFRQAEYYGWRHEAWKFSWLLLWHGDASHVSEYWEQFRSNFRQIQMPLGAAILSLRRNCGLLDTSTRCSSPRIYLACLSVAFGLQWIPVSETKKT